MNRTWALILLGALLGFALMGMALRGCESGADASADGPELVPRSALSGRDSSPLSALIARPAIARPEPVSSIRSALPPAPALDSIVSARLAADGAAGVRPRQTVNAPPALEGFNLARAMAESRRAQNPQQPTRGASVPPPTAIAMTDPEVRQALERRNELLRQSDAPPGADTLDARLLAESELLDRVEEALGRPIGDPGAQGFGDDQPDVVGAGATTGDAALTGGAGTVSSNPSAGGGSGGGSGSDGGLVAGPGAGTGAGGVNNPFDPSVIGDPTPPPPTLPPLPPLPSQGEAPAPVSAIAVWRPVQADPSCQPTGTRTNDLFVGFDQPVGVQVVTSAPPLSLGIVGGQFVQNIAGGNSPPDAASLAADPCLAIDSFLTIGDAPGAFFGGPPPPPANWGSDLNMVLITPLDQPLGIIGVQDPARFGDNRFYVRLGRFTATGNPDFVGGTLVINGFNSQTFQPESLVVPVPHCADCWFVEDTGPTGPALVGLQYNPAVVNAGEFTVLTVTISEPAPEPGVVVAISTVGAVLDLPDTITILPGETSASILVTTPDVPGSIGVTTLAQLDSTTVFADLRIEAVPTEEILRSVEVLPRIIRGGESAEGVVTLARNAPPGGLEVLLSIDDPAVARVPGRVLVPEGEFQATFRVDAGLLDRRRSVLIWAAVGEQVRTTSVLVTLPTDLSGDGRIDGADITHILNAFGAGDPAADLNGDGAVDGADITFILNNFTVADPPGEPAPFSGEVIARWVPAPIDPACADLAGLRANDLYLGFDARPNAIVISSSPPTDIRIENGGFHQNPDNLFLDKPPTRGLLELFPCAAFDSFLTIGGTSPSLLSSEDPADWGPSLDAVWFTTDLASVIIEQDPFRFGDDRFYVRIGRFVANEGARVLGGVEASFAPFGGEPTTASVEIANCPVCWRSFDLTGDGAVSAADVARLMDRLGTDEPAADLDGDGDVDADDLSLVVGAATSSPSP